MQQPPTKVPFKLQDGFFNEARKEAAKVRVGFADGSHMTGLVLAFDDYCIKFVNDKTGEILIYKHALSFVGRA